MTIIPRGSNFYHFLRIQVLMLFAVVPFSIFLVLITGSFLPLFLPLFTFPAALITFHLVNFVGEGSGRFLYGGGSAKTPYADSGFYEADMQKANAKRREGKYREAVDMYEKIFQSTAGKPDALFELAQTFRMAGNWDRARYNYMKLVISFEEDLGSENFFVSESRTQGLNMVKKIMEEKTKKGGNGGDAEGTDREMH